MICHVDSGGRAQCNVVDPGEVARAVDRVRRDSAPVESALADVLRDPRLNEDERDQIIRTLLDDADPNTRLPFFGHAGWRTGVGADPDSLSEDLRVIADALQGAYDRGVLKKDPDLLRAYASIGSLLDRGVDVLSRPGIAERAIELASDEPAPGPTRAELVSLVSA